MPEGPLGGPRPAAKSRPVLEANEKELEGQLGEINDRFDLTRNMLNRTFTPNNIDHPDLVETRSRIHEVKTVAGNRNNKILVTFQQGTSGEVFKRVFDYFMSMAAESTKLRSR